MQQSKGSKDFNTSHVYINLLAERLLRIVSSYFNTSHVYINQTKKKDALWWDTEFQYISCLY